MRVEVPRRSMIMAAGALVLGAAGCGSSPRRRGVHARGRGTPAPRSGRPIDAASATEHVCGAPTEPNIEGPYYRAGAPRRADLRPVRAEGVPLTITGCVRSLDCSSHLGDAVLDVWHADAEGRYDNDGHLPAQPFLYRGVLAVDARGAFQIHSVVPGRYLNGRQYRPAHVHVKVTAPGHQPLTTQLYFPDDPFNDVDPFIRKSLVMEVEADGAARRARYDFVLSPVS